jgi:hypothetical protein
MRPPDILPPPNRSATSPPRPARVSVSIRQPTEWHHPVGDYFAPPRAVGSLWRSFEHHSGRGPQIRSKRRCTRPWSRSGASRGGRCRGRWSAGRSGCPGSAAHPEAGLGRGDREGAVACDRRSGRGRRGQDRREVTQVGDGQSARRTSDRHVQVSPSQGRLGRDPGRIHHHDRVEPGAARPRRRTARPPVAPASTPAAARRCRPAPSDAAGCTGGACARARPASRASRCGTAARPAPPVHQQRCVLVVAQSDTPDGQSFAGPIVDPTEHNPGSTPADLAGRSQTSVAVTSRSNRAWRSPPTSAARTSRNCVANAARVVSRWAYRAVGRACSADTAAVRAGSGRGVRLAARGGRIAVRRWSAKARGRLVDA